MLLLYERISSRNSLYEEDHWSNGKNPWVDNISLPKGARKIDFGEKFEDHGERCHALKASCSKSHAFFIDSGASNHMVSSRESFSSLQAIDGLSIHMGDDTQILDDGNGSIKLKHGVFINVLYFPSLAANLLFVYLMTHTGSPKWLLFGPESMEITYISTGNIIAKGVVNHA